MANKRFIDFPIATTVGDNDIILIWQSGANKQTTKATILSGVPDSLNDLTDVTISGLTNGQILRYDSVSGQWENTDQGNLDLNDLNDVTIVSPTNGQVLVYNSTTSKWENSSAAFVPYVGAVTTVNLGAQTIQAGSFVKQGGTASQFLKANGSVDSTAYGTGSVTSVALTMPTAFSVAGSPITTAGTLAVTGAGTVAQYIRGDGSLADFPESSGGGSSVSYYLNGSVAQGTIGGIVYKELSKVPILGAGTDFTINADGYIASFITDAGDPNLLEIPGGNWNFETYFSASSGGGSPTFYVELYKVNAGGTATLIASSSTSPELIAFGTNLTPYFSSLAVPTTTLALTDRLAVRYYVTHSGRTITLHTENNHLCQIITTFTTGLTALNGLTAQVQNFAVGTTGTDFNIASAVSTHTFNLPTASATNRGALSSADWGLFTQAYNDKINSAAVTGTTTKTLTLTQQDGGTITASWSDLNTDAVLSVFGRTGNVIAVSGDYTTAQVTESGNLYYTDARSRAALSFAAGSGAYNTSTGVITIPTNNNQIANGAGYITSAALAGYLPLTGGTLTGPLGGTSANFSTSTNNTTFPSLFLKEGSGSATYGQISGVDNFHGLILRGIPTNNTDYSVTGGNQMSFYEFGGDFRFYKKSNSILQLQAYIVDGAATFISSVSASSFIRNGGTSSQYLMADGSVSTLSNPVTGTGTTNYLPKFYGLTLIGNSALQEVSGNLGLGVTPPAWGGFKAINIGGSSISALSTDSIIVSRNWYYDNSERYFGNGTAQRFEIANQSFFFQTATNNVSGAGAILTWSSPMTLNSSGRLLLGTTDDNGARLQVSGYGNFYSNSSTAGNANGIRIEQAGSGDSAISFLLTGVREWLVGIDNSDSDTFKINNNTGGSDFNNVGLAITTSGNLGLGVTPSAWSVIVPAIQIGDRGGYVAAQNGTNVLRFGSNHYFNGSNFIYTTTDRASFFETGYGEFKWFQAPSGTAGTAVTFTQPMTITTGGNLIINPSGTYNQSLLTVKGSTSDGKQIHIVQSNDDRGWRFSARTDGHFYLASTYLGTDSNVLNARYDTGNVLIGTITDNGHKLAINAGGTSGLRIDVNSGVNGLSMSPGAEFNIDKPGVGGGTFKINSSGNVGIGTNSPSANALLHLVQNTSNLNLYLQNTNGSGKTWALNSDLNGGFNIHDTILNRLSIDSTGEAFFSKSVQAYSFVPVGTNPPSSGMYAIAPDSIAFSTNTTNRMTILGNGRVLIGTQTDAGYNLNVNGTGRFTPSSSSSVPTLMLSQGSAYANIAGAGDMYHGLILRGIPAAAGDYSVTAGDQMSFYEYGGDFRFYKKQPGVLTQQMRITTDGNVFIGTTTTIGPAAGRIDLLYSGLIQYGMNIRSSHTDGIAISFVNSSGTQVGTIYQNGSSTAYNTSSDYRLKEDLKEFNGIDLINKIKTYDFKWKSDNSRSYGVVAHELQEVINYAVFGQKDSLTMQGVDYSKLVPILIKSIQELKQEIDTLKN